eukprot:6174907-Pyramimonas_sp.AAC.1
MPLEAGVEGYGNMKCDKVEGELRSVRLLASKMWVGKIVAAFSDIEFAELDETIYAVEPASKGIEYEDDGSVGQFGLAPDSDKRRLFNSAAP